MERKQVFKQTEDDWCGNYIFVNNGKDIPMVKLTFYGNISIPKDTPEYRVSCWGNDDLGMDKDFDNEQQAYEMYLKVLNMPIVNQSDLIKLGFNYF
jgi:hypothetical protein